MTALKIAQYDPPEDAQGENTPTHTPEGNVRLPSADREVEQVVDWSMWIEIDRAAEILRKNVGSIRRECNKTLERSGMAMRSRGPENTGQRRWWIKRDYKIVLHENAVGVANRIPEDFYTYTEAQRNQALARASCVKRYRTLLTGRGGPRKTWIKGLISALRIDFPNIKISERSLYRWHGTYDCERDLVKLIDKRGGNRTGEADPAAWQYFCELFLHVNQRSRKLCWRLTQDMAREKSWVWMGYRQCVLRVRRDLPLVVRVKARRPEHYRNALSPHMVMDPEAFGPGERWQGDHCVLDLFCRFPGSGGGKIGRPWVTAWLDTKSRKCVGWVMCESPSSETIRAALAQGLRDPSNMGGPDICHIDNGKDYKCGAFVGGRFTKASVKLKKGYADTPAFNGLFGLLDIKPLFAIPHNSRGKGGIESFFNYAVHQRFDKLWDTYAGKDPANRPPGLQAKLKDKASVPTFEQVREAFALFVDAYNNDVDHGKEDIAGMSPNQVMATARERVLADPGVLDFASLTFSQPVRVNRHAVTIRPLGKALRYTSTSSAFLALVGTSKMVVVGYRQEDLFGQVYIFDAETMRMICSADHERAGTSTFTDTGRADIKAAMARQRRVQKAEDTIKRDGRSAVLPLEVVALRERNNRKHAEEVAASENAEAKLDQRMAGTKLVQTVLDGQSNRLQAAKLKKAVGAETGAPGEAACIIDMDGMAAKLSQRNTELRVAQASAGQPIPQAPPAIPMPDMADLTRRSK